MYNKVEILLFTHEAKDSVTLNDIKLSKEIDKIFKKRIIMRHTSIITSSVREGRISHNVSLYLQNYLTENKLATTEIIDLKAYNFPHLALL